MDVVWIIFLFLIGTCLGSFLNVVIYRLPRGESIVFPGSHCPGCGNPIKWYDNLPILSWLILRGRCRKCKCRISPRYIFVEALTGVLLAGLFVCYYVLRLRQGTGTFEYSWPMFAAQGALFCGLLAASAVDIELFIVPLPVMWFCAAVGIVSAAAWPQPETFLPAASPKMALVCLAASAGLGIGQLLLWLGVIQPSFIDADDKPLVHVEPRPEKGKAKDKGKKGDGSTSPKQEKPGRQSVGMTKDDGVNPRVEVLRELLFLLPAIALGVAAWLIADVPAIGGFAEWVFGQGTAFGRHAASAMGAVEGLLAGVALIWGIRILGTLGFGKEAMGMGDVHIMAAIGAVAGWQVAALTFFAAPIFGLLYALYLLIFRGKRELPYGPWLAAGTLGVMLFYDWIIGFIRGGLYNP